MNHQNSETSHIAAAVRAVEDGHLTAHIATAAGRVAEAARYVAACIDVVDGYTHINDVIR